MSDNKKFYFKVFFSSMFALGFLVILIFNPFGKNEGKNKSIESLSGVQSVTSNVGKTDSVWTEIFSGTKEEREIAKNEIVKQIEKEKIPDEEKNVLKEKTSSFFSAIDLPSGVVSSPTAIKPIGEKSAYKVFPEQYLNYVSSLAGYMEKGGFISKGDIGPVNKVSDVINVFGKTLDYFLSKNIVSGNEYVQLYGGLTRVWPSLLENEFKSVSVNGCPAKKELTFFGRIKGFLGGLIEKTQAQSPICFRPGAPNPEIGVNLWAPCCACYCPPAGEPCGCLNLVCPPPAAALFDPTTGICGCG